MLPNLVQNLIFPPLTGWYSTTVTSDGFCQTTRHVFVLYIILKLSYMIFLNDESWLIVTSLLKVLLESDSRCIYKLLNTNMWVFNYLFPTLFFCQ